MFLLPKKITGFLTSLLLLILPLILLTPVGSASAGQRVTLSVIDVAGVLSSVQVILDNYKKAFPDKIADIKIQRAPEPELPAKIKAQQEAGRVDINLIMCGMLGGSQLVAGNQLVKLFPDYGQLFPTDDLTEEGKALLAEGEGYLLPIVANSGGPLFVYNPKFVRTPPTSAYELLEWAKANPRRLMYARPANSGPGNKLLAGLPYMLKDRDPKDPEAGWEKTWAYLKELSKYIEYYPTGTGFTLREFAQDARWMIAGTMEWDMKPRAEGTIPPESKMVVLDDTTFIIEGLFLGIPKGVPPAEMEAALDLMKFMRQPQQQLLTWKAFIGPSIKTARLDMAPPDIQKYVKDVWRAEYGQIGTKWKVTPQIPARKLNYATERWDREIGAEMIKR